MRVLSIILILAGIGGFMEKEFFPGFILLIIGIILFKKSKKRKSNNKKDKDLANVKKVDYSKRFAKNTYTFRVAGVTKEGRQGTIKEIVKDWKEYNPDDIYEGMSNKDIKDLDIEVYEADIYNWCNIELIPEPDNKYDPNAIKVVSEFGMLGYVPANETSKVRKIMEEDYSLNWELVGGKYKYFDDYEDKVKIETLNYGIEIHLNY